MFVGLVDLYVGRCKSVNGTDQLFVCCVIVYSNLLLVSSSYTITYYPDIFTSDWRVKRQLAGGNIQQQHTSSMMQVKIYLIASLLVYLLDINRLFHFKRHSIFIEI